MSVLSVDQLKGVIGNRGGIAKGNRFRVEIPDLNAGEDFQHLCRQATMPGKQILTADRRVGMTYQKIAYGYASEDVSLAFLLTGDMFVKEQFERWQQQSVITTPDSFHFPRYKNEYQRNVYITSLDKEGRDTYRVKLIGAFPTTVNAINYSDENESILQLEVQLSYTRWEEEQVNNNQ